MTDAPREHMRIYDLITVARHLAAEMGQPMMCDGVKAHAYSDDAISVVATDQLPVLIIRLRMVGYDGLTPAVLAVNDQDRIEATLIGGIGFAFKHIMEITTQEAA